MPDNDNISSQAEMNDEVEAAKHNVQSRRAKRSAREAEAATAVLFFE